MREDAQHRATEFLKELYAAGDIDADRFDTGVTGLLAAKTEAELAEVVRSLPGPVTLTSPDRRLAEPLEIHSGLGRLRLAGQWQVAAETHISADLGSVRLDLTQAEFDDHVIDLHVYSGWRKHHDHRSPGCRHPDHQAQRRSRLAAGPAGARAPVIRLDVTAMIGRVHLRHPAAPDRGGRLARRRPALTPAGPPVWLPASPSRSRTQAVGGNRPSRSTSGKRPPSAVRGLRGSP